VKILVLGAGGMIGHAMFRILTELKQLEVWGTVRSSSDKQHFNDLIQSRVIVSGDIERRETLPRIFSTVNPEVVINCIGLTKHRPTSRDSIFSITMNALFPHRLSDQCAAARARLIHVSTDCVFSGSRGNYSEIDTPDASDIYGRTKQLGEVDYPHAVTLRTSTIGHELKSEYGLLNWFLAQKGNCKGFARAKFSGLTNIEFACVVRDYVITNPNLRGVYHVGGESINKYDLLCMIADIYGNKNIVIRDEEFVIDRSLDSSRFNTTTGYLAPKWHEMIKHMYLMTTR
jgi:dTDP-4-dehydrorhamnose reductase